MWPNELVTGWCITERVKRLSGNEIELGIGYRRSNLGQVTYQWQREQHMLLCGLTDKDLRRICRNQYGHPGPAIGYWPRMVLGHVYIVLEPVGFARLTLRWQLLWVYAFWCTEVSSESRMWSRTWRGVSKWSRHKDWILDGYIRTPEVFRVISEKTGVLEGYRYPPWEK